MDVRDVISRVKNLKEFKVEFTFDNEFLFSGKLPFDLMIGPNNKGIATVLALSQEEAEDRVIDYFHNTILDNCGFIEYDELDDDEPDDDDEQ